MDDGLVYRNIVFISFRWVLHVALHICSAISVMLCIVSGADDMKIQLIKQVNGQGTEL